MATTKVTLRKKTISKRRKSLYLDFWPPIEHPETGNQTRREFLGLYIFDKPKNLFDKQHNLETIAIAEQIRSKRENVLNKPEIYTEHEKKLVQQQKLSEQSFIDYFKRLADKHKDKNRKTWISVLNYLETFAGHKVIRFVDIDKQFCEDFKSYLLTTKSKRSDKKVLAQNTALSYFNKFKAALREAYPKYLQTDINAQIKPIKEKEVRREYLTLEELNMLVQTPCNNELLKRAALFSALTGLRFSDIQKMTWKELRYIEGQGCFLHFEQEKTEGIEYMPISEQAYNLLGTPGDPESKVFDGLKYSAYENSHISQWIGLAGISRKITFHAFRHSYATLQLTCGTDITVISKMLGHKSLKTTQLYAKIVDKAKREAANRIKLDL